MYDEWENYTGDNTPELSLQSWEPRTLLQVHPVYVSGAEVRVRITYGILHRMDGGYRNDNICTNFHSGDTQNFIYYVRSYDSGASWRLETVQGWEEDGNEYDAAHDMHEWTGISGDFERPRLRMYLSAGKHHPYPNGGACEDWDKHWCDDDCGGGAERMANLHPWEYYTNVGEPSAHPMDWGLNQPFVTDLFHIGYPNEYTWYASWLGDGCGDIFTGGMNPGPGNTGTWVSSEWPQSAENCVTPVYRLFPTSPL
jgi:hypothetical protein